MAEGIIGILILLSIVFAIILVVCWIALPFYVQGNNKRLDKIIELMEKQGRGT